MVEQLDLFKETEKVTEQDLQKIFDKKTKEKSLTPRQWELYRLIYHNSMVEYRKTGQKEICDKISDYNYSESNNTSDHCTAIWTDVTANNLSVEHEKVIITKNYEYWIGSKEEEQEFVNDLWSQLLPRVKRYWFYLNKTKLNGQGKIISDQNEPITEDSQAREFIESFNPFNISKGEEA